MSRATVYLPRVPSRVNSMYAAALKRSSPFTDNPSKGQEHFFRGVRQPEKMNFLNKRYSIGPHDKDPVLCGFHHAEVFGWWFDPSVHEREIPDDDVFWSAAADLTPDHLDIKSKVKLIRHFGLSPSGIWRSYFGNDWQRAYTMTRTDPIAVSLLDAETLLLGLRFDIRKATNTTIGGSSPVESKYNIFVDVNTSQIIDLFDYLEKRSVYENIKSICNTLACKPVLGRLMALEKALKSSPFKGTRSDLISEVIMSAFIPVPKPSDEPQINIGNFNSALGILQKIDAGLLKRKAWDESSRDPLFFIFANCCRGYAEFEPDVYRFEF